MEMNFFQKMVEIRRKVPYVKKDTTVSFGSRSYSAVSHDHVTSRLVPAMNELNIWMETHIASCETEVVGKMHWAKVMVQCKFLDADNPEGPCITVNGYAQGCDTQDKAIGKAISMAVKYILLKTFMLETGENEEQRYPEPKEPQKKITAEQAENFKGRIENLGRTTKDFIGYFNKLNKLNYKSLADIEEDQYAEMDVSLQNWERVAIEKSKKFFEEAK